MSVSIRERKSPYIAIYTRINRNKIILPGCQGTIAVIKPGDVDFALFLEAVSDFPAVADCDCDWLHQFLSCRASGFVIVEGLKIEDYQVESFLEESGQVFEAF